jgi:hypothetical protein
VNPKRAVLRSFRILLLCRGKVKRWRLGCEQASDLVYARGAGPEKLQRGDRDRVRRLQRNSGGKKGLL